MSAEPNDRRTRRRLLEAAVARLEAGALPGRLVEEAAAACGVPLERARMFFPRDEAVVLALYQRIAYELEAHVPEIPEGTVSERFRAAMAMKLALVAPYRRAFAALIASALDPRHELGVLSERTEIVREQVLRAFTAVVLGASDRPAEPEAAEQLARVLYAAHLGLLLLATQDRSEGQVATEAATQLLAGLVATPMALAADAVVRPLFGTPSPETDETARWILRAIMKHRRLLPGAGACAEEPCERCFALHLPRVRRYVAAGEPVHMLLPAFPAKSPSPKKTIGKLPDLAEERALEYLQRLCDEIATLHAPGARVTICSDGHVFSDLVGVADDDVTAYGRAIGELIEKRGLRSLERFGLEHLYDEISRDELVRHYGEPLDKVEKRTSRAMFNGIHRFLFEDRVAIETKKSRTQIRNECHDRAYQVIQRSNAWSRLIADCFPSAVRLSIHPQPPHSEKIGFLLGDSNDVWLTPWHGVTVQDGERFSLMPRHEAEGLSAKLVAKSHFVRPSLGVVVTGELTHDEIDRLLLEHRIVILRGQKPMEREAFVKFAEQFGQVLEWEFGAVNDLVAKPDAKNYLYTNRAVPFHWDGAFVGKIPRAILFQCLEAPAAGMGGETLFADTTRMLEIASHEQKARWAKTRVTYSTEKVVHYGGTFTSPVLAEHPISKAPIIRFAEPVADLNPVSLAIEGEGPLVEEMGRLLRDPRALYAHTWRDGDIVLADNHALLHGRNAFAEGAKRRIQRINVL